jgi:hypothetical protein
MNRARASVCLLHEDFGIPAVDAETQCEVSRSESVRGLHWSDDTYHQSADHESDSDSEDEDDMSLDDIRIFLRQFGVSSEGSVLEIRNRYSSLLELNSARTRNNRNPVGCESQQSQFLLLIGSSLIGSKVHAHLLATD